MSWVSIETLEPREFLAVAYYRFSDSPFAISDLGSFLAKMFSAREYPLRRIETLVVDALQAGLLHRETVETRDAFSITPQGVFESEAVKIPKALTFAAVLGTGTSVQAAPARPFGELYDRLRSHPQFTPKQRALLDSMNDFWLERNLLTEKQAIVVSDIASKAGILVDSADYEGRSEDAVHNRYVAVAAEQKRLQVVAEQEQKAMRRQAARERGERERRFDNEMVRMAEKLAGVERYIETHSDYARYLELIRTLFGSIVDHPDNRSYKSRELRTSRMRAALRGRGDPVILCVFSYVLFGIPPDRIWPPHVLNRNYNLIIPPQIDALSPAWHFVKKVAQESGTPPGAISPPDPVLAEEGFRSEFIQTRARSTLSQNVAHLFGDE